MTTKLVKVTRTLVYYGPKDWIAAILKQNYVQDNRPRWLSDDRVITSSTGEPEPVSELPSKAWDSGAAP